MFGDAIEKDNQIYRRLEYVGQNIHADRVVDESMAVALKLLLSDRTEEPIIVSYQNGCMIEEIEKPALDYDQHQQTNLHVVNLNDNSVSFETIKNIDLGEDWERLDKLCEYTDSIDKINYFINKENHKAVVVMAYATASRVHFVAAFVSRIMPWFFEEKPIKSCPEDIALVKALAEGRYADFVSAAETVIAMKGLDKEWLSRKITDLFVDTAEKRLQNAEREVENIRGIIKTLEQNMSEKYREMNDKIIYLHGARYSRDNAKDASELNEYIMRNPQIKILDVNNGTIKFSTEKYLDNYPNGIEAMLDREGSTIYQEDDSDFSDEQKRKLFEAIFKDNTIRVKLRAELTINVEDCHYEARQCDSEDKQLNLTYPNALNNPHLTIHNCFGGYRSDIASAIQSGEIMNMLMITDACVGSLNILEDATFNHFVKDLLNTRRKVCEVNGEYMTPKEAVEWLEGGSK